MNKALLIGYIFGLAFLLSCNKPTPAGFWKTYKEEFKKKDLSGQTLNGGYRALYWSVSNSHVFNSNEVLLFAKEKGWSIVDSVDIETEDLKAWYINNIPIFPLRSEGFDKDVTAMSSTYENFPRWINRKSKVYMFKTGWLLFPGGEYVNESIDINGFIMLDDTHTEMAVYHLWGK